MEEAYRKLRERILAMAQHAMVDFVEVGVTFEPNTRIVRNIYVESSQSEYSYIDIEMIKGMDFNRSLFSLITLNGEFTDVVDLPETTDRFGNINYRRPPEVIAMMKVS